MEKNTVDPILGGGKGGGTGGGGGGRGALPPPQKKKIPTPQKFPFFKVKSALCSK